VATEETKAPSKPTKWLVGRRERIDFPMLSLFNIEAKVDTGAFTSAIHCHHVKAVKKQGGVVVRFSLLDPEHPAYVRTVHELPLHARRMVKNSFGQAEARYSVLTSLRIFGEDFPVELTLADRSKMEYPVLLGRKLLAPHFLVDSAKLHLSLKAKHRQERQQSRENRDTLSK